MEQSWFYLIFLSSLVCVLVLPKLFQKRNKNLPPTPPSIPIIGHLHLIKEPVHRTLQDLSLKYGPIMSLKFGSRPVVLISSSAVLEECFTKNDITLSSRPLLPTGKLFSYNFVNVGAAPYGPLWRELRKVTTLEFFSTNKLNMYLSIRQEEVINLLKHLFRDSRLNERSSKVEMKPKLSGLSFNVVMRMLAGKRYFGDGVEDFEEARNFQVLMRDTVEFSGTSNPGDFLPFMRWFDFQNINKRMLSLFRRIDVFLQGLIDEHRSNKRDYSTDESKTKTVIDVLLSMQDLDPERYTDDLIKSNVMLLLLGGTDTSSLTMEWAMSLLLNHPKVLEKARAELDKNIGKDKLVDEADLPKLTYIQCIINETLRLFPVSPLLVPRESSDDCTIGGFHVPRGTILLTNAWAIHRDQQVWDDPTRFRPERFVNNEIEKYKLVPFGMGRRQCPGIGLANRVMGLTLAALIQCFDWERVSEEMIDLTEGKGLSMPKDKPLEAMCKVRGEMVSVLSEL